VKLDSSSPAAAELAAYYRFKWSVVVRTAAIGGVACLVAVIWSRYAALALGAGFLCGIVNALGIMRASERLVETRNRALFGLSSLLRLAGFSIVAAALAARGPWWSLGPFLAGFFFPLAAYALGATRHKPSTDP
jgi:hypothetical protein